MQKREKDGAGESEERGSKRGTSLKQKKGRNTFNFQKRG